MKPPFRLIGAELSPYSVKVRSYLRFKGLEHTWLLRSAAVQPLFERHAKLALIPLLIDRDETAMQDSTPILERLEAEHPDPAAQPADPWLAFLSALIEDYADEWLNKAMFHYRWSYPADQARAAFEIGRMMMGADPPQSVRDAVTQRMTGRLVFVGSNPQTTPIIEQSYGRVLDLLDAHLATRPYLFGARPVFADFGIAGQLYELAADPTPGALMRAKAPNVAAYVERMNHPASLGEVETWQVLAPTLTPFVLAEVRDLYLPWLDANAAAIAAGAAQMSVALNGAPFTQEPQKYAARALHALRAKAQPINPAHLAALGLEGLRP